MRLKDQSQMLHRLIRRIVETKPRVGVCRHYLDAGRGSHQTLHFSLLRCRKQPVNTCPAFERRAFPRTDKFAIRSRLLCTP